MIYVYVYNTNISWGYIYDGNPPNKEMVLIVFYVSFDGWDLAI